MRIAIYRAQPVTIAGQDLLLETRTRAPTIGDLLSEREVVLGPLDRVEPSIERPVPTGGEVRIIRVREEQQVELQLIPYRTVTECALPQVRVTWSGAVPWGCSSGW
jgi:uncharacterized protein YabE (DUF348 family)